MHVCIPAATTSGSRGTSPAHKPAVGAEAALQRERSQQLAARAGERQDVQQQQQQQAQQQEDPRAAAADAAQRSAAAQAAAAAVTAALEAARQQLAAEHGTIAGAVLTGELHFSYSTLSRSQGGRLQSCQGGRQAGEARSSSASSNRSASAAVYWSPRPRLLPTSPPASHLHRLPHTWPRRRPAATAGVPAACQPAPAGCSDRHRES